uniref:Translation elongation factor EFTu/EF1A C-terminal domain-containing protein n=2 Tax=Meloidogyne incognita group TaxID=654580 RepID=A0A915MLT0_MELJA
MPCSGLTGAFLKERPSADVCNWYTGLCFLDYLDALPPIKRDLEGPTRAIVANKFSDMGTIVVGKLESGMITKGQQMLLMPNRVPVQVLSCHVNETETDQVYAGDSFQLKLKGVEDTDIMSGFVLCSTDKPCPVGRIFDAEVVILEYKSIITSGFTCVLHIHEAIEEITVKHVIGTIDKKDPSSKKPARFVKQDDKCILRLESTEQFCMDLFKNFAQMGRFMLRDEEQMLSHMFTPSNSLPTPIVPTKVPNIGTSSGNLVKQTKNGWKVSNLNFGINQDDSICLSIKLEKSANINEIDKQKVKATLDSIKFIENLIVDNNSLNEDDKKNLKDVGFVDFFRFPIEEFKLEQYALSNGICNSIEKVNNWQLEQNNGQNQNFPPFMPQPPISQPYGYNNYSAIQQPLNNNFQQNIQSKPSNSSNSCNNQPQKVEDYENLDISKNGWIVDNLSFTIETKSIELVINLEDTKIGKNGNNNSKAAMDAIKYIEKLLVDCSSNKGENNNEELLEEKIKELNLNDKAL